MNQETQVQTEAAPSLPLEGPSNEPEAAPQAATLDPERRLAELEAAVEERDARLKEAESRTREVLEEREKNLASLNEELQQARQLLSAAVGRYRQALLAASPGIPEELVRGQSVEEVDASISEARRIVERIRADLEKQTATARTPLGAPVRSGTDLSAMSAQEKIAYALGRG